MDCGCLDCRILRGGCLDCKIKEYIEKKDMSDLDEDQLKAYKTITGNTQDSRIYGSFLFRVQAYPGDIDIMEDIYTKDDIYIHTEKVLKRITRKILKTKGYYFSEAKIGIDHRYYLDPTDDDFKNNVDNLFEKELLTKEEYQIIKDLYNEKTYNSMVLLKEKLRNKFTLRWNETEILKGYKMLIGNVIKTLLNALHDKSPIKIDMFAPIDGRYIEITNFFIMKINCDVKCEFLNIDQFQYEKSLKDQIEKFLSPVFFNLFKVAKRMWALSRYHKKLEYLKLLTPLINSSVGRIYQMKSEISTIILMIKKIRNLPINMLKKQIDQFNSRIAMVPDITSVSINRKEYSKLINEASKNIGTNKKKTLEILDKLLQFLNHAIHTSTKKYLIKHKLIPISDYFLPENTNLITYDL